MERVLLVQILGAPRPRRRDRRVRESRPSEPEVPLTRLTVTLDEGAEGAQGFEDERSAGHWLDEATSDAAARAESVRMATRLVNLGLAALRAEARDPLVQDIGATRALAVRIGYGEGLELVEGRWKRARELPRRRRGRLDDIDPQSRVAAVLGGRDQVDPAETMLERARLDIEQGRREEARLGLRAARDALRLSDPKREPGQRRRIEEAEEKLAAGLDEPEV